MEIIALIGSSGSGKTCASLYLQQHYDWNTIVSYTTRPIRKGERDGVEHWFVSPTCKPANSDEICAYTHFGGYEYWTSWTQFEEHYKNVYVIDEKGLIDLLGKSNCPPDLTITAVRIVREDTSDIDNERLERDKDRTSLPDHCYNYIIHNNGTLQDFYKKLDQFVRDVTLQDTNRK